ncbi:hypothetical protein F53441_2698 [Fusarium austroafricanum]|uniref:Uncharacterized protein n=1 Tax=Fusarium austroafricanum TaxID=2364996 RepID=A0A8H4KT67_9HYPO|nr:hypothetical protein F53441_2698 [Fusarium austroafricanum]
MVKLTLLIAALASSVFADKAVDSVTEVPYKAGGHEGCITYAHLQALAHTYTQLNGLEKLPPIPDKYTENPTACIPESLFDKYYDAVVAIAKEQKLLENFSKSPRGVEIFKRIRDCPEIKAAAIGKKNTYSCISADNPAACESCMNFGTANFAVAIGGCISKGKGAFCCAAAATAFSTYYTQTCLEK